MVINHYRFKDFTAMTGFVQDHVLAFTGPFEVEAHIYEEGMFFRPGVTIYSEYETLMLRWYAFSDEEGIDFIGQRARVQARDKGGDYVNLLIAAVEQLSK